MKNILIFKLKCYYIYIMCFSETQSYINTVILFIASIYLYPKYRLSTPLIFLALKDLIQGLSYRNIKKNKSTQFLTSLSWIHICFQPLFFNIFLSYFSKKFKYWNIIFCICIIFGLYYLTILNEFDIQNDPDCIKKKEDDFCSKNTMSYIGKYHIGYKFKRDKTLINFLDIFYFVIMIIPSFFTNSRILSILWTLFVGLIYILFHNIGSGEQAAIWCFLSIVYMIPISVFNKQILKYLS
tara:strand:- start:54 stop:770 length:717 start_codon:yes stop_codon:yes gene_type:complete